jgi:hypothetical protein
MQVTATENGNLFSIAWERMRGGLIFKAWSLRVQRGDRLAAEHDHNCEREGCQNWRETIR